MVDENVISESKKPFVNQHEHADEHEDEHSHSDEGSSCNIAPYLLAVAMGVHAVFAGLALGISSDLGSFLGMLLAILAHKWAEALTIGISFAKNLEDIGMRQALLLMIIFALSTPIGIAIGIIFSSSNQLVTCIMMGISAGTFIYISSAEIIVEEFSVTRHKKKKFVFYLLGFALMISVYFIEKAVGGE